MDISQLSNVKKRRPEELVREDGVSGSTVEAGDKENIPDPRRRTTV